MRNLYSVDKLMISKSPCVLLSDVVSVSLFSQYGRALELLPDRSATFLVSTVSLGDRMQPWVLDELTGLWRERDTKVIMRLNFNKRREKVWVFYQISTIE